MLHFWLTQPRASRTQDAGWLKHYVAAALRLEGGALQAAAAAFGELPSLTTGAAAMPTITGAAAANNGRPASALGGGAVPAPATPAPAAQLPTAKFPVVAAEPGSRAASVSSGDHLYYGTA